MAEQEPQDRSTSDQPATSGVSSFSDGDEQVVEFDYSGTPLADSGSEDEIQGFVGAESWLYGRPGVTEAIWLIEGNPPWKGVGPRPVYRVRWRPMQRVSA